MYFVGWINGFLSSMRKDLKYLLHFGIDKMLIYFSVSRNKFSTTRITINSSWPWDAIWWQRSDSTLTQVMACCLTAPSHYLNQCWLLIRKVLWHSPESNFTAGAQVTTVFCMMSLKIIFLKSLPHLPDNELIACKHKKAKKCKQAYENIMRYYACLLQHKHWKG